MMKLKGFLMIVCLILMSNIAAAQFDVEGRYAIVNGKEDWLSDNEKITVYPGSVLQIKVVFSNDFTEEEDNEISVELEGVIEFIDDGERIHKDDFIDVEPESSKSLVLEFHIPLLAYDDDFLLELDVNAEDDDGNNYNFDFDHRIEIVKLRHELRMENLKLDKETLGCDSTAYISFDVLNTGSSDEDTASYVIENNALSIAVRKLFSINEGDKKNIRDLFQLNKKAPAGKYELEVTAYCSDGITSVKQKLILTKEACDEPAQTTQTATQTTQTATLPTQSATQATNTQTASTQSNIPSNVRVIREEKPDEKNPYLPTFLIINIIVIAVGITVLVAGKTIKK